MDLDTYDYYGSSVEADRQKIEDPATGKPVFVRRLKFKFPPGNKGVPTKEQILTPEYVKHIENMLWADALEMILSPKVVYEKGGFSVFLTCQAKKGNIIPWEHADKLKPLQDILTKK